MSAKAPYQTKQMAQLVAYLKKSMGTHITVQQIHQHFQQNGISVSTTTIYRHLERMVSQGLVAKYTTDGTAYFEYLDKNEKCHAPECYHCKCEVCGKLIHLQCHQLHDLIAHLQTQHGFALDGIRTIFYGTCKECAQS